MLFKALGWVVWGLWAALFMGAALSDGMTAAKRLDTLVRSRATVGLMALVGASWTLWALVRG